MKTKTLLMAAAAAELGTGLGLLIAPSLVAELLFGQALGTVESMLVGRVAGTALMAIGLACGLEGTDRRAGSPTALLAALLLYNAVVAVLLALGAVFQDVHGMLLWPVVLVHAAFAIWCATSLTSERRASGP
jgi:hypothetical protein